VVRRALLITLCVLVFVFVLRAKTSVYNGSGPAKVTPTTASKLWFSGQKLEVQTADNGTAVLFWMAIVCVFGMLLRHEPRLQTFLLSPPASNVSLRYLHRFLRPPPVVS
jgi:hypothetical protein